MFKNLSLISHSILIGIVLFSWYILSSLKDKLLGLMFSLVFSSIEYTWISMTVDLGNGEVEFRPFDKNCRKGHTVN